MSSSAGSRTCSRSTIRPRRWRSSSRPTPPTIAPTRSSRRSRHASPGFGSCAAHGTARSRLDTAPFGHDLALPSPMVQHGRRAVYDPEPLASEKPSRNIEDEYRRKVRMFEHCWLIVLRGRMLRGLGPPYLLEVLSHRHLRYASGLLHLILL